MIDADIDAAKQWIIDDLLRAMDIAKDVGLQDLVTDLHKVLSDHTDNSFVLRLTNNILIESRCLYPSES